MKRLRNTGRSVSPVDRLLGVLDLMSATYADLHECLGQKLDCLRRADLDAIQACLAREQALFLRLVERHNDRKRETERVGRSLGMAPDAARTVSLRQLAKRLSESQDHSVSASIERLETQIAATRATAGLIDRISHEVLEHIRETFKSVAAPPEGDEDYGSAGDSPDAPCRKLFEAVG